MKGTRGVTTLLRTLLGYVRFHPSLLAGFLGFPM